MNEYNLVNFILAPSLASATRPSKYYFFQIICGGVAITLTLSLLMQYIINNLFAHIGSNAINRLNFLQIKTWLLFAFAAILEECSFRGFLSSTQKGLQLTLTGIFFIIGNTILSSPGFIRLGNWRGDAIYLSAVFVLAAVSFVVSLSIARRTAGLLSPLIRNNFSILLWVSSVIFALSHISNYHDRQHTDLLYIPLILPQLSLGILLGFVRVRFGLFYSIACHFLINSMLVSILMTKQVQSVIFSTTVFTCFIAAYFIGILFFVKEIRVYFRTGVPKAVGHGK